MGAHRDLTRLQVDRLRVASHSEPRTGLIAPGQSRFHQPPRLGEFLSRSRPSTGCIRRRGRGPCDDLISALWLAEISELMFSEVPEDRCIRRIGSD